MVSMTRSASGRAAWLLLAAALMLCGNAAVACDFATARRLQGANKEEVTNATFNPHLNSSTTSAGSNASVPEDPPLTNLSNTTTNNTSEAPTPSPTSPTASNNVTTTTTTMNTTAANTTATEEAPLKPDCVVDPNSPVQGLHVELRMLARQTRGSLRLLSNCRFEAQRLEVAVDSNNENEEEESTIELDWYAAASLEVNDVANRTLLARGGTLEAFELMGDLTLVFDTVLDLSTVGAILLCERTKKNNSTSSSSTKVLAQALIQKLQPGPAADLLAKQPTYFENCLGLSDSVRVRWTTYEYRIDVGLEYIVPGNDAAGTCVAFGPASPGIEDRLMGGSDVHIAGFREDFEGNEDGIPFAEDYYISGYEVCTEISDGNNTYDGVCSDSVWADGDDIQNDAELLYSQILEGVALLRIRRPLKGSSPELDHDITPGTTQHFVWARGPLEPDGGMAEVQFHGYQYGQLKSIDVNETTWSCPPLKGIELSGPSTGGLIFDDGTSDAFAEKFDHRTVLQGDVVEVFWTLLPETSQIHIGALAMVGSSKWMSVAVGDSMTDAWAWVATIDGDVPQLLAYRMSGLDATTVRLLSEDDEDTLLAGDPIVAQDDDFLSFEVIAQWPLPGMSEGETTAPLIWALGPSWRGPTATSPKREDEHSLRSKAPTNIDFATGDAKVGDGPENSLLLAHGALMFLAWLVVAPLTGAASRYVRNDPCVPDGSPSWIQWHKNGAVAVMVLSIVGLILAIVAISDAGLRHIISAHAKVGVALLAIVFVQNFFGLLRPSPSDVPGFTKRRVWELSHRLFALAMLALAMAAVITGSTRLEDFDSRARYGVTLTIVWIVSIVLLLAVYELRRIKINSFDATTPAIPADKSKEEELLNAEEPPIVESNSEPESKMKSPWISTWMVVYAVPFALGIAGLVVLTAITFSGPPSYESQMMKSSVSGSTESSGIESSEPVVASAPAKPYVPTSSFDAPESCEAVPSAYVGDGWCDDHEPFNTEACAWDGGDCCDTSAPLYNCRDPKSPHFGSATTRGWVAPIMIPRNPRYTVSREESLEAFVISYNNYYEFGFSKDVVDEANMHADFLSAERWYLDISGLVENPMTLDVASLIEQMQLEERLYRHRCVEAWSITAPWVGFPLAKILDMVKPKPEAEIVQFVSWKNFTHSKAQSSSSNRYPWPYTEALTMEEARNELTMLTVGAFGKPLTPQQGAPIRLNVPWKYGFKSIKSIEKITFLADDEASRRTFWSEVNSREYGFFANVNPEVPHRRWSQATERHYVEGFPGQRLDTTRMNGYQEYVDYMYDDLDDRDIYF